MDDMDARWYNRQKNDKAPLSVSRALCNHHPPSTLASHTTTASSAPITEIDVPQILHKYVSPCHLRSAHGPPMRRRFQARRPQNGYTEPAVLHTCCTLCRTGLETAGAGCAEGEMNRETCLFETGMQVRCHLTQTRIARRM